MIALKDATILQALDVYSTPANMCAMYATLAPGEMASLRRIVGEALNMSVNKDLEAPCFDIAEFADRVKNISSMSQMEIIAYAMTLKKLFKKAPIDLDVAVDKYKYQKSKHLRDDAKPWLYSLVPSDIKLIYVIAVLLGNAEGSLLLTQIISPSPRYTGQVTVTLDKERMAELILERFTAPGENVSPLLKTALALIG